MKSINGFMVHKAIQFPFFRYFYVRWNNDTSFFNQLIDCELNEKKKLYISSSPLCTEYMMLNKRYIP